MNTRILSILALVTAVVSTPVFTQEAAAAAQKPVHALRHYRGTYNEVQGTGIIAPRGGAYGEQHFDAGFDRSRIGDYDPDLKPSGS
jgi:hypothetical protein